jgi:hypothetical protein
MRARRSKRLWEGVFGSIRRVPKSRAIGHRGLGQPGGHPSFVPGQGGAQKTSERTEAGMVRAKAKGIKIGRPRLGIELRQKIAKRAAKGETPYAIAKALGIDRHTAAKYTG